MALIFSAYQPVPGSGIGSGVSCHGCSVGNGRASSSLLGQATQEMILPKSSKPSNDLSNDDAQLRGLF